MRLLQFLANRRLFNLWERLGIHVTPVHFYQPLPDTRTLRGRDWAALRRLPGIDWAPQGMLRVLTDLRPYFLEFKELLESDRVPGFAIDNGFFEAVDADLLFAIVRRYRPARILEIGCGYSSLVIDAALCRNREESGEFRCEHIMVDPYPSPVLSHLRWPQSRVRRERAQDIRGDEVESLSSNDILFVDSSHVLCAASDVEHEFRELIPAAPAGALVHIHDVFTPQEYPERWIMEEKLFWNEQYLLEAFLAFNSQFGVFWAGNYARLHHPEELAAAVPHFDPFKTVPGSVWIRRVDSATEACAARGRPE